MLNRAIATKSAPKMFASLYHDELEIFQQQSLVMQDLMDDRTSRFSQTYNKTRSQNNVLRTESLNRCRFTNATEYRRHRSERAVSTATNKMNYSTFKQTKLADKLDEADWEHTYTKLEMEKQPEHVAMQLRNKLKDQELLTEEAQTLNQNYRTILARFQTAAEQERDINVEKLKIKVLAEDQKKQTEASQQIKAAYLKTSAEFQALYEQLENQKDQHHALLLQKRAERKLLHNMPLERPRTPIIKEYNPPKMAEMKNFNIQSIFNKHQIKPEMFFQTVRKRFDLNPNDLKLRLKQCEDQVQVYKQELIELRIPRIKTAIVNDSVLTELKALLDLKKSTLSSLKVQITTIQNQLAVLCDKLSIFKPLKEHHVVQDDQQLQKLLNNEPGSLENTLNIHVPASIEALTECVIARAHSISDLIQEISFIPLKNLTMQPSQYLQKLESKSSIMLPAMQVEDDLQLDDGQTFNNEYAFNDLNLKIVLPTGDSRPTSSLGMHLSTGLKERREMKRSSQNVVQKCKKKEW
ncbi:Hypothetical_protein [Hexamita inflata]|uniref:Hypothetical_protein n=1 Tax=Hexamita inflata TaxID=28002 RepID=A0AA86NFG4_9EUKA|nr:Hypothetical protein HINF_LOCUS6397 [Hexamita inflata]CAI9930084.1 Hypothetical protein HINF_LOCUS17729 [Hexamita inflata]